MWSSIILSFIRSKSRDILTQSTTEVEKHAIYHLLCSLDFYINALELFSLRRIHRDKRCNVFCIEPLRQCLTIRLLSVNSAAFEMIHFNIDFSRLCLHESISGKMDQGCAQHISRLMTRSSSQITQVEIKSIKYTYCIDHLVLTLFRCHFVIRWAVAVTEWGLVIIVRLTKRLYRRFAVRMQR
jgi:hypothetical protein